MSHGGRNECRIYVGNLPPDIRTKDIQDLFYKFGKVTFVDLKNRRGPPFAFVEFDDPRWVISVRDIHITTNSRCVVVACLSAYALFTRTQLPLRRTSLIQVCVTSCATSNMKRRDVVYRMRITKSINMYFNRKLFLLHLWSNFSWLMRIMKKTLLFLQTQ